MNGQLLHLCELIVIAKLNRETVCPAQVSMGYIGSCRFRFLPGAGLFARRRAEAASTAAWLEGLRRRGLQDICLCVPAATTPLGLLAFSGSVAGCTAGCNYGRRATRWQAGWAFDTAHGHWDILYTEQEAPHLHKPQLQDPTGALETTLEEIGAFAEETGYGHFNAGFFQEALAILRGSQPPYSPFPQMPQAHHRLFDAAQSAWVFGGMGSWNDIGFAGDDTGAVYARYSTLSSALHSAIMAALVYAINSW